MKSLSATTFRHPAIVTLIIMAAVWVVLFSLFSVWKYLHFGYNVLDLSIYTQVLSNTAGGHPFAFTIHPHSYLGDHVEIILLFIAPIFGLLRHPLTLTILQILALASGVWPLYLIVRKNLSAWWSTLVAGLYLLSPLIQNAAIFEFHALAFSAPIILWALYFYRTRRFIAWLVALGLLLIVREDMALIVFMFGVLALIDRCGARWAAPPMIAAAGWFAVAIGIAASLSGTGQYKFFTFFGSDGPGGFPVDLFMNAGKMLHRLFSTGTLSFIAILVLPLFALPFVRPRVLTVGALYGAMLFLSGTDTEIALFTHYAAPLVPILFVGLSDALAWLKASSFPRDSLLRSMANSPLLALLLIGGSLYGVITIGPIPGWVRAADGSSTSAWDTVRREFIQTIPSTDRVVATYSPITLLAERPELYSFHYGFIGHRQLSSLSYTLPDADSVIIDAQDIFPLHNQYHGPISEEYVHGDDRIRSWLTETGLKPAHVLDRMVVLTKDGDAPPLYSVLPAESGGHALQSVIDGTLLLEDLSTGFAGERGIHTAPCDEIPSGCTVIPTFVRFDVLHDIDTDYALALRFTKDNATQWERLYPAAYGLYPTSEWNANERISLYYPFWIPPLPLGRYDLTLTLVHANSSFPISSIRSRDAIFTDIENVGTSIDMGTLVL